MSGVRNASSNIVARSRAAISNAVAVVEAADATATSSTATVRSKAKARPLKERLSRGRRQSKARQRRLIVPKEIARPEIGPLATVPKVIAHRATVLRVIVRKGSVRMGSVRKATARPGEIIATMTIAATRAAVSVRVARVPRAAMTGPASVLAVPESAQAVNANSRQAKRRAASAKSSLIPIHPSPNCWRSSSSLKAKALETRDRETRRAAIEPRAAPA